MWGNVARDRADAFGDFVDALELLDELLDELACRDSEPSAGPPRERKYYSPWNRGRLERVSQKMLQHAAELEATALERERARERDRIRRREQQAAIDACEHDWQPLEGMIDQCSKCRSWRPVSQLQGVRA